VLPSGTACEVSFSVVPSAHCRSRESREPIQQKRDRGGSDKTGWEGVASNHGTRVGEDGTLRSAKERIVRWNSSMGVYIVSFLKLKRNFRL
jgi:hypothetical protein